MAGMCEIVVSLPARLTVREIDLCARDAEAWDQYASLAGGTMRSAHAHLRSLRTKYLLRRKVTTYGVFLGGPAAHTHIGHFTIIARGLRRSFYDGLKLQPEHQNLWVEAMQTALRALGPGTYEYGCAWALEPCRQDPLETIDGVVVSAVEPAVVQGIDYAQWASWDDYFLALNKNKRREAKNAKRRFAAMKQAVSRGHSAIWKIIPLARLRGHAHERKQIRFSPIWAGLRYLLDFALCPSQAIVAYVEGDKHVRAIARTIEFGPISYYVDAGAAADNRGAAWRLVLSLIRDARERNPQGKFLLGYYYLSTATNPAGLGLLRARAALRVSEWRTSLIRFDYKPPFAGLVGVAPASAEDVAA
jgi:hypothetical protein